MIRIFPNEEFREFTIPDVTFRKRYAISNKGRLANFKDKIDDGAILNGSTTDGYRVFQYKKQVNNVIKSHHVFIGKLVAEYFLPKTSEDQKHVLHLDYARDNDDVRNLRWATYDEMIAHGKKSPKVIEAKRKLTEHNLRYDGHKLTVTRVMLIKKMLQNPEQKTRKKMIAKQFGISETSLRRIELGISWGHIKV